MTNNQTSSQRRNRLATAALAFATLSLAACGGGGSGGGSGPVGSTPTTDPTARVAGPLDPIQTQLEGALLNPLASALSGTPLAGVVDCANELVNYKILDTVDVLAGSLALSANPADLTSLAQTLDPAVLTERVRAIAFDTAQLLLSLNDSGTGCATLGNSVTGNAGAQQLLSGSNPLAGTPFEALGSVVGPAISQLLSATGGARPDSDLPLASLLNAYQQFNTAVQTGLALLPADAQNAPVVGGVLLTVGDALNDLGGVFTGLSTFNPTALQAGLTTLLSGIAGNLTTNLLPLGSLEGGLGQPNALSGLNALAVGDFGSTLAGLISGGDAISSLTSLGLLSNVLSPLQGTVLEPIIDLLSLELGSNPLAPGGTSGDLLTGTPLAPVVDIVSGVVGGLLGGVGGGGAVPCLNLPLLGNLLCPSA